MNEDKEKIKEEKKEEDEGEKEKDNDDGEILEAARTGTKKEVEALRKLVQRDAGIKIKTIEEWYNGI